MNITQMCNNAHYSIRFVEFIKSDGHLVESYFELIANPVKCIGIFNSLGDAKAEMMRLTELQGRRKYEDSILRRRLTSHGA